MLFKIKFLLCDSAIILIFGSVPDFLTNILPLDPISFFASLIAFLVLDWLIIFLSLTRTFSSIWGNGLKTFNSLLALIPFLREKSTSSATSNPSPVVANFPKIICPDCSPPKLKLSFLYYYVSIANFWSIKFIFFFFKKFCKPKLDIKVPITPPFKIF